MVNGAVELTTSIDLFILSAKVKFTYMFPLCDTIIPNKLIRSVPPFFVLAQLTPGVQPSPACSLLIMDLLLYREVLGFPYSCFAKSEVYIQTYQEQSPIMPSTMAMSASALQRWNSSLTCCSVAMNQCPAHRRLARAARRGCNHQCLHRFSVCLFWCKVTTFVRQKQKIAFFVFVLTYSYLWPSVEGTPSRQ